MSIGRNGLNLQKTHPERATSGQFQSIYIRLLCANKYYEPTYNSTVVILQQTYLSAYESG